MSTILTGRDPAATTWPLIVRPNLVETTTAGYTATGGTALAVISDNNDTTYLNETNPTDYFRVRCNPITLPKNARLYYVSAAVRGRAAAGNTKYKDALIGVGDHSNKGIRNDNWKTTGMHYTLSSGLLSFYGKNTITNSLKQPMGQTDLQKGLYVLFGLNTVYGPLSAGAIFTDAWVRLQYDMPPSAVITYPANASTLNDTAAPEFVWDYTDDLQPQAKYWLTVTDTGSSIKVYDSGLRVSSQTAHTLPFNLPNGNYRVDLTVYQAWPYPGGDFKANGVASNTFTVGVAKLGIPRIKVADNSYNKEFVEVITYPGVNLLDFETSTFDRGTLTWFWDSSNGSIGPAVSPVRDGGGSGKFTITSTTAYVSTRKRGIIMQPGDYFNGLVYVNPLALSGRTAQLAFEFYNAAGTFLSESVGSVTALPTNTWTAVQIANITNVNSTVKYIQVRVKFASTINGDIMYLDDAALWHANGAYRNNLFSTTSWEGGAQPWTAAGSTPPTLTNDTTKFLQGTHSLKMQFGASGSAGDGATSPAFSTLQIGKKYTASAHVWIPSGAPDVSMDMQGVEGKSSAGVRNQWTRISVTFTADGTTQSANINTLTAYTGSPAIWVDELLFEDVSIVLPWFNGSSAGAFWDGGTDTTTSHLLDSFPVWSRGGFFEFTPNLLTNADSSFEDDSFVWVANGALSGSTVAKSATQHLQGAAYSLLINKSTAGTNDIEAILGNGYYFPCVPGQIFRGVWGLLSDTTARTVQLKLNFVDSSFVSTGNQLLSIGTSVGSWIAPEGAFGAAPANSAYFWVSLRILAVATTTEKHYLDAVAVYDDSLGYTGYWSGQNNPANTDVAPTLLVEYQNTGESDWHALGTQLLDADTEYVVFPDYSLKSGVSRVYRASLAETENGLDLNSDYSTSTSPAVSRTLKNVWIASDDDPTGTSHWFNWDGGGKKEMIDAAAALVDIEGSEFPFAQFGVQSRGTVDVDLMLETANDQAALDSLARKKSLIIYRDGRGRAYRGILGAVNFIDIPSTGMKRAGFTLQLSGDQP